MLSAEFEIYRKKYRSADKQFDRYFIFIERAIDKVKDNGFGFSMDEPEAQQIFESIKFIYILNRFKFCCMIEIGALVYYGRTPFAERRSWFDSRMLKGITAAVSFGILKFLKSYYG